MVLPFDLRQQGLNMVQIPPRAQPQFMGLGAVGSASRWFLNCLQTRAKCLIDHPPERRAQPRGNRSRSVQNVVVYDQCCSHNGISDSDVKASFPRTQQILNRRTVKREV